MELLIIRHAIAFECDRHRWYGGTRPLSAAAELKEFSKAHDRLPTSFLVLAMQTAMIRTDVVRWPQAEEAPEVVTSRSQERLSNKPTR